MMIKFLLKIKPEIKILSIGLPGIPYPISIAIPCRAVI
jgi:hypothetical protein